MPGARCVAGVVVVSRVRRRKTASAVPGMHRAGMDSSGVRGFVAVPVWVNGLTTVWVSPSLQCKLSAIIIVQAAMDLLSWTAFLGGLQPQQ